MSFRPRTWAIRGGELSDRDHTLIMGIVNVTPDSFSDGGLHAAAKAAIHHGCQLWQQGADIIDVGGESTRPGADEVLAGEELARVIPVVSGLVERGITVSIDTTKAEVAAAAVDSGAHIVNDVSALSDPEMADVCSRSGVGVVLMHMQGRPRTMQDDPQYDDLLAEVAGYLDARAGFAADAGIEPSRVCVDPGIGFGKTFDHNLELLNNLARFTDLGYPVLVGTSRKGFLGAVLADVGIDTSAAERDLATAATVALCVGGGASVVRVHNVGQSLQAARIADAIVRAS